jgi:hypothetical protein
VPAPSGEGRVLRFGWKDPEATLMTCLVGSDLDNYARLTCVWLREDTQPSELGGHVSNGGVAETSALTVRPGSPDLG